MGGWVEGLIERSCIHIHRAAGARKRKGKKKDLGAFIRETEVAALLVRSHVGGWVGGLGGWVGMWVG